MPLWSEIDTTKIEVRQVGSTRTKATYLSGPVRFQIPRGYSRYGLSQYKSISISNLDPKFKEWFENLEKFVSRGAEPFKSTLSEYGIRLKMDDTSLVFDKDGVYKSDEHLEGYLRDLDMSCIVDVEGAYLWKGTWALSCRIHQIKFYEPVPKIPQMELAEESSTSGPVLKGCAFLS
jgi:hypothetical protein